MTSSQCIKNNTQWHLPSKPVTPSDWVKACDSFRLSRRLWLLQTESTPVTPSDWVDACDSFRLSRGLWLLQTESRPVTPSDWVEACDSFRLNRGLWLLQTESRPVTPSDWVNVCDSFRLSQGQYIDIVCYLIVLEHLNMMRNLHLQATRIICRSCYRNKLRNVV